MRRIDSVRRRLWREAIGCVLSIATLSSCRTPSIPCLSGLREINVVAGPLTNDDRVITVDVVSATSASALRIFEALTATEYFTHRDQLWSDFRKSVRIQRFGFPLGQFARLDIHPPCHVTGTLIFVDYDNGNMNRIRVGREVSGTLGLKMDGFTWQPK